MFSAAQSHQIDVMVIIIIIIMSSILLQLCIKSASAYSCSSWHYFRHSSVIFVHINWWCSCSRKIDYDFKEVTFLLIHSKTFHSLTSGIIWWFMFWWMPNKISFVQQSCANARWCSKHCLDLFYHQKNGSSESTPLPSPPPLPKRYCSNDGYLKSKDQQSFLSTEFDASKGYIHQLNEFKPTECPVELDPVSARQLLLKSVSAVCVHTGFEC